MNDFAFQLLKIIVSVCAAFVTAFVVPYLRQLKDNERYAQLINLVSQAVRAAEQTIRESGQGAVKKAQVIEFVMEWMDKKGVSVTYDQLSELVEAAVWQMKNAVYS